MEEVGGHGNSETVRGGLIMKLAHRLMTCGVSGAFSEKQMDALLAATKLILGTLRDDLLENEPEARDTVDCLEAAMGGLPADMAAVRALDRERERI